MSDMARTIRFTLPFLLPTLNQRQRTHWRAKPGDMRKLAWAMVAALPIRCDRMPFEKARITITRHSSGTTDPDGLYGSVKPLLDILCTPQGQRHPTGLGIIRDDSAACITLTVQQAKAKPREGRTEVVIEECSEL